MTTVQWNQVTAAVEQLPAEKQAALAALVLAWLEASPSLPTAPVASAGCRDAFET